MCWNFSHYGWFYCCMLRREESLDGELGEGKKWCFSFNLDDSNSAQRHLRHYLFSFWDYLEHKKLITHSFFWSGDKLGACSGSALERRRASSKKDNKFFKTTGLKMLLLLPWRVLKRLREPFYTFLKPSVWRFTRHGLGGLRIRFWVVGWFCWARSGARSGTSLEECLTHCPSTMA